MIIDNWSEIVEISGMYNMQIKNWLNNSQNVGFQHFLFVREILKFMTMEGSNYKQNLDFKGIYGSTEGGNNKMQKEMRKWGGGVGSFQLD